jgi:hypothetical protein
VPIVKPPSVSSIEGVETCKVAKDPLNPFVVEWRGAELTNLEASSAEGVVITSYVGCTLKVLRGCHVTGSYALTSTSANRDTIVMSTKDEVYARLPLGAAALAAHVGVKLGLALDYVAVGVKNASAAPAALTGDCEGATHYISSMTVGAFHLHSMSLENAGVSANVGTIGAGVDHGGDAAYDKSGGDVDQCTRASTPDNCRTILQIGLAPLPGQGSPPEGAPMFGVAKGALGEIPTVGAFTAPKADTFANLDVGVLELLQLAQHADKNSELESWEKATAWSKVAKVGTGDLKARAEARSAEWWRIDKAEIEQKAEIEKLGEQYVKDRAKLDRLLGLEDTVVSHAQKQDYVRQFDAAYRPYVKQIAQYLHSHPDAPPSDADLSTPLPQATAEPVPPSTDSSSEVGPAK